MSEEKNHLDNNIEDYWKMVSETRCRYCGLCFGWHNLDCPNGFNEGTKRLKEI